MAKRKHHPNPLEKTQEWLDHRYDPGYWTGGRIVPWLRDKNLKVGRVYLLEGIVLVLFAMGLLAGFAFELKLSGLDLAALGGAIALGATLSIDTFLAIRRRPGYVSHLRIAISALLGLLIVALVVSFRALPKFSGPDEWAMAWLIWSGIFLGFGLLALAVAGVRLLRKSSQEVYALLVAGAIGGLAGMAVLAVCSPAKVGDLARFGLVAVTGLVGFTVLIVGAVKWLQRWFGK